MTDHGYTTNLFHSTAKTVHLGHWEKPQTCPNVCFHSIQKQKPAYSGDKRMGKCGFYLFSFWTDNNIVMT